MSCIPTADLIAYERDELDPDAAESIEEHFFACASCTERLESIARIATGVVDLVRRGAVSGAVTRAMLARGAEAGLRIRTYEVAPGEQVACTAAPSDDFVSIQLAVDAADDEQIDLVLETTAVSSGEKQVRRVEDVPFDRREKHLVLLNAGDEVRAYPRSRWRIEAVARGPRGVRLLGVYGLDHSPWEERADPSS
jgi:hypothetical protein